MYVQKDNITTSVPYIIASEIQIFVCIYFIAQNITGTHTMIITQLRKARHLQGKRDNQTGYQRIKVSLWKVHVHQQEQIRLISEFERSFLKAPWCRCYNFNRLNTTLVLYKYGCYSCLILKSLRRGLQQYIITALKVANTITIYGRERHHTYKRTQIKIPKTLNTR